MNSYALKFSLAFSITLVVCVAATMLWISRASGQFGVLGTDPFGGRILASVYCTCSGTISHTIGPPVGGQVMYVPGQTTLYAHYQAFAPPPWQLGLRGLWRECRIVTPTGCVDGPPGQTMGSDGTSIY